ncbi:MAG: exodeoxyribonuclease VII large subunit [Myxococcales bacterium]|nr:exodeoxyribonuclease VII large subunit [Myxococcales bacterium]
MTEPAIVVHSVTELNRYIAAAFVDCFSARVVEGEVSAFNAHSSGHWYFKLKDDRSCLDCTMWKSDAHRQKGPLRVGEKVRLFGDVRVYESRGTYSFQAQRIERAGEGTLAQRLEALRERLSAEGLFDPAKRRVLPRYPRAVGLATAADGAAIGDMVRIIRDRAPHVQIVLAPCRVQGDGAAADVARAIRWLNSSPMVDVIIAGRGGGSAEDLFAFNEEVLVRAVAASRVPIVSAVGHEKDQCLCDLAADERAPTPTAAAEMVVPDAHDLARDLDATQDRLDKLIAQAVRRHREKVNALRLLHPSDRLARTRRDCDSLLVRLDGAVRRLTRAQATRLGGVEVRVEPAAARGFSVRRERLHRAETALAALSPVAVLDRGYAIVHDESKGEVVRDASHLSPGALVGLRFARGAVRAKVE